MPTNLIICLLASGAIILAADESVAPPAPRPGPTAEQVPHEGLALWLAASNARTEGGRVVAIADSSGGGNDPVQDRGPKTNLDNPVLATDATSGRPVLRFDGSNSSFSFKPVTGIRTVFWVVAKDRSAFKQHQELFVLGSRQGRDFHVGTHWCDTLVENGGNASIHLRQAKCWFNGFPVDPRTAEFSTKLAVICFATTGDVEADQISRDREFPDRAWKGDIAEILLYTRVLEEPERGRVESYLMAKYAVAPVGPVVVPLDSVVTGKPTPPAR